LTVYNWTGQLVSWSAAVPLLLLMMKTQLLNC